MGFEFLLHEKKRQVGEAQMKEKRERRLQKMESGKKDDIKKMIQTTIHWAQDKALGKSQVTKVAWIALESLQYRDNLMEV